MKNKLRKRAGFTLIEMTIVLFIISLLILIIIPNVSNARHHAQEVHGNAMTSVVQSQIDEYLEDHPSTKSVGYDTLVGQHYLTSGQRDKAENQEHIHINGKNKAHLNGTDETNDTK